MQFPFGAGLGGFLDLTWPPMLTSKNTTGLTGLEFATAMALTRKQKPGAPGSCEPNPRSAGLDSGAGAGRADQARGRGPAPWSPALAVEGSLVFARKLGNVTVARASFGPDRDTTESC